jgi:hypothetical protein
MDAEITVTISKLQAASVPLTAARAVLAMQLSGLALFANAAGSTAFGAAVQQAITTRTRRDTLCSPCSLRKIIAWRHSMRSIGTDIRNSPRRLSRHR